MKIKLLVLMISTLLMTSCLETGDVVYMSKYQKKVQRKFTKRQLRTDVAYSRKVKPKEIGGYNDKTVTKETRKGLIQNRKRHSL